MHILYVFRYIQPDFMINYYNDIIANLGYEYAKKI